MAELRRCTCGRARWCRLAWLTALVMVIRARCCGAIALLEVDP